MQNHNVQRPTKIVTCFLIAFLVLLVFGVILAGGVIYAYVLDIPEVVILKPTDVHVVETGNSVVVAVRVNSRTGYQGMAFYENDTFVNQHTPTSSDRPSEDWSFLWFANRPGIHKLTFYAYSKTGRVSKPASAHVLITPRMLGSTTPVDDRVDSQNEDSLPKLVTPQPGQAIVSTDLFEALNQASSEEDQRVVVNQILEELEDQEEPAEFPLPLPESPQDNPPQFTSIDISFLRVSSRVQINISLTAEDDLGVDHIHFELTPIDGINNPGREDLPCQARHICPWLLGRMITEGGWWVTAFAVDTSGQLSEQSAAQFHVVVGGEGPLIAVGNIVGQVEIDPEIASIDWEEIERQAVGDVISEARIAEHRCEGQIVILEVPYIYTSDHGETVYLDARAYAGENLIASGNSQIQHGSSATRIEMTALPPYEIDITDQLELKMRSSEGEIFESLTQELGISWLTPLPDLVITEAAESEETITFEVKNIGCAPVRGFNYWIRSSLPIRLIAYHDVYLIENGAYQFPVSKFYESSENDVFEGGYSAMVDSQNLIPELDETNNTYLTPPYKYDVNLLFTKMIIHDISEGAGQNRGEFYFETSFGNAYQYENFSRWPKNHNKYYNLKKNTYDFFGWTEPIQGHYEADYNSDLSVYVSGMEYDTFSANDYLGYVETIHGWDRNQVNNWKDGGEFCQKSQFGHFTLCYQIEAVKILPDN